MCGFAGFASILPQPENIVSGPLAAAGDAIAHRGPDDSGNHLSQCGRLGLTFRRLAIQDLSAAGHQPMRSASQRYTICFNGEIYNHLDLRARLPVPDGGWRGHSDTETLLQALDCWGIPETLSALDGMFAFALWDSECSRLHFARDRFGEKPLYYGLAQDRLVFGSELKALPPLGLPNQTLDREAIALYFRYRYIPAPRTVYRDVNKLLPGEWVIATVGERDISLEKKRYWQSEREAADIKADRKAIGTGQILDDIEAALLESLKGRLLSDVSLGCFLSGGIDSSLTVALAQKMTAGKVNTYTIRFDDPHFNEADHARAVADHLGTRHREMTVTERDALNAVSDLSRIYDEPFADPSQIPTILLCRAAKEQVTVALSGDGGDEFFAGYSRYARIAEKWNNRPSYAAGAIGSALAPLPWQMAGRAGAKLKRKLMNAAAESLSEYACNETGFWREGVPVRGVDASERRLFLAPWPCGEGESKGDAIRQQMVMDASVYLPEDLQVKTDRAAMAAGLEVRTPFLNADLARYCWSLPTETLTGSAGREKFLLQQLLFRHVPRELVDRPKQGFDVPLRRWLREGLRDWGDALIFSPPGIAGEYLDMDRIRTKWNAHQKGRNGEGDLWPALVMLDWMRRWHG